MTALNSKVVNKLEIERKEEIKSRFAKLCYKVLLFNKIGRSLFMDSEIKSK